MTVSNWPPAGAARILAAFERIVCEAEAAQARVQDDGLVSGEGDRRAILAHAQRIQKFAEALVLGLTAACT